MRRCRFKDKAGRCVPPGEADGPPCSFVGTDYENLCAVYPMHLATEQGTPMSTMDRLLSAFARGAAQQRALGQEAERQRALVQEEVVRRFLDQAEDRHLFHGRAGHIALACFAAVFVVSLAVSLLGVWWWPLGHYPVFAKVLLSIFGALLLSYALGMSVAVAALAVFGNVSIARALRIWWINMMDSQSGLE